MKTNSLIKIIYFTLCLLLFCTKAVLAYQQPSIYETSILWKDEVNKAKLLKIAPKWQHDTSLALFDVYLHPERAALPQLFDLNKYNLQFIHAWWGPKTNPFLRYPRPAKVFIFLKRAGQHRTMFYVAPLIQDNLDANYYVFDNKELKPILLNDWVNKISYDRQLSIRMNVCDGYGSLPIESCDGRGYQYENEKINNFNKINHRYSAVRALQEDWHSKVAPRQEAKSIYGESISWNDIVTRNSLLNTVETWPNLSIIKENFQKLRDLRYLNDEEQDGFARRVTWLYPDDGCWTRAAAVIKDLFGPFHNIINKFKRPSKVFAFGNLCANTANSPSGEVAWWYHTAPIVRDASTNQTYVLDPSVNAENPLPVEKWMAEISSKTGACADSNSKLELFNICNGYASSPDQFCQDAYEVEDREMQRQLSFQGDERYRQTELGRVADDVLGDSPPWE